MTAPPPPPSLPPGFVWGASTASYQIEGAVEADGRAPSIWDTYCRQTGRIARGESGAVACDHYHRWAEDVALMRDLGLKAYRFSIAWPRILPQGRGAANEPGLAFYDRLIDALLEAGIEPWICLYHWDMPQALGDRGGWIARDAAGWFADYAALIARRYGDRVKRFATFNEPSVFTLFGFAFDWHPPGMRDRDAYHRAIHHVNLAHGAAVDVLRALVPGASLGAIHNVQPCLPIGPGEADARAAQQLDAYWNRAFPDPQLTGVYPAELAEIATEVGEPGDMARICRPVDWFGLNHYSPIYARAAEGDGPALGFHWADAPKDSTLSGIGWRVDPDAFRETLLGVYRRYRLPIYVTENGAGSYDKLDANGEVDDQDRIRFLDTYITAMGRAVAEGADVRGYFVWSLLDNFEWGSGYDQRFGIVYVDYPTQRRIPKASARWYADLIGKATRDGNSAHAPG